ncbi:MAG: glycosyltransferase family 4 protein [Bacteroidota bacterium]
MQAPKNKQIIAVHLLNDYSGSPLVFSTILKGLIRRGYQTTLFTSSSQGFLSDLDAQYHHLSYRWLPGRWIRLMAYLWSQLYLLLTLLRYRQQNVIIYVNTLLPFGAALAGVLMGKPVIYHIHETSVSPALLKRFLRWVANRTASEAIFVSHYLQEQEALNKVNGHTIYNGLSSAFLKAANLKNKRDQQEAFRLLMLCSLRDYKGVREFTQLASMLPDCQFDLVLNADQAAIDTYFAKLKISPNLHIYPSQSNVHQFYQKADLVLNLSHPEQWIETFGMTILEAMHYGIPCIVPPIGGPTELIEDGQEGYLTDQRNIDQLFQQINYLKTQPQAYQQMANKARLKSQSFSSQVMINQVHHLVHQHLPPVSE